MRCKIISEIASNWEGNMDKAKKLIMESKVAGADGVKFQRKIISLGGNFLAKI